MDDLISRRAAIKAIDDLPNCYNGYSDTYDKAYIIGTLEEVPTIEPKRGKWIQTRVSPQEIAQRLRTMKCSCCGEYQTAPYLGTFKVFNFCPNCGARMENGDE